MSATYTDSVSNFNFFSSAIVSPTAYPAEATVPSTSVTPESNQLSSTSDFASYSDYSSNANFSSSIPESYSDLSSASISETYSDFISASVTEAYSDVSSAAATESYSDFSSADVAEPYTDFSSSSKLPTYVDSSFDEALSIPIITPSVDSYLTYPSVPPLDNPNNVITVSLESPLPIITTPAPVSAPLGVYSPSQGFAWPTGSPISSYISSCTRLRDIGDEWGNMWEDCESDEGGGEDAGVKTEETSESSHTQNSTTNPPYPMGNGTVFKTPESKPSDTKVVGPTSRPEDIPHVNGWPNNGSGASLYGRIPGLREMIAMGFVVVLALGIMDRIVYIPWALLV